MLGRSLSEILTWVNILYLVSLAFSLLFSVTLWRVSVGVQVESDSKLEMYKADSAKLIAVAQTQAKQADERAAIANAEAGKANERAAALELLVEEERAEIQRLVTTVDKISPRMLLPAQAHLIRTLLRQTTLPRVPITVGHDMACVDCNAYASQIAEVLRSADFPVTSDAVMGVSFQSPTGLAFSYPDFGDMGRWAAGLEKAFVSAGLPMDVRRKADGSAPAFAMGYEILVLPRAAPR